MGLSDLPPSLIQRFGNGACLVLTSVLVLAVMLRRSAIEHDVVRLIATAWGGALVATMGLWTARRGPILASNAFALLGIEGVIERNSDVSRPGLVVEGLGIFVTLLAVFVLFMAFVTMEYYMEGGGRGWGGTGHGAGNPVVPLVGLRLRPTWATGGLLLAVGPAVSLGGYLLDRLLTRG